MVDERHTRTYRTALLLILSFVLPRITQAQAAHLTAAEAQIMWAKLHAFLISSGRLIYGTWDKRPQAQSTHYRSPTCSTSQGVL